MLTPEERQRLREHKANVRAWCDADDAYRSEHPDLQPPTMATLDVLLRILRTNRETITTKPGEPRDHDDAKYALRSLMLNPDLHDPMVVEAQLRKLHNRILRPIRAMARLAPSIDHDYRLRPHPDPHAGLENLEHWLVDARDADAPDGPVPTFNRADMTIDVATAARRLGKSEPTIRRWCRARKHPCHNSYQHAHDWHIPEADVPFQSLK